jgi:peptidoglycan/xylan/chitin deacetylase (PgdA/CDA1 family)
MRTGSAHVDRLVGITFDDGYANVLENAVPELLKHSFTATMFIVTERIGGTNEWDGEPKWPLMSARQIAQTAALGMEIGSHSSTHTHLAGLSAGRLRAEITDSRRQLSELLGRPIHGFAYPYGNMDASARQAVRETGYEYACAVGTPTASLGIMALPRISFGQRDGAVGMRAKTLLFKGHIVATGARMNLSGNRLARRAKRPLAAFARLSAHRG